jgi:hypothetical protein
MSKKLAPKIGEIYHWQYGIYDFTIMIASEIHETEGYYDGISVGDLMEDRNPWHIYIKDITPYTPAELNAVKRQFK